MSDSERELQSAQERLYEDEGLRENLTDDQATPLLKWASQRLGAAQGTALEQAQEQVRAVLRLVDKAAGQDEEKRQATLSRLPDLVRDLPGEGPPPPLPPELERIAPRPSSAAASMTAGREAPAPGDQPAGAGGKPALKPDRNVRPGVATPGQARAGHLTWRSKSGRHVRWGYRLRRKKQQDQGGTPE